MEEERVSIIGINLVRKRSKDKSQWERKNRIKELEVSTNLKDQTSGARKEGIERLACVVRQRGEIPLSSPGMVVEVVAMGVSGYGKMESESLGERDQGAAGLPA